jgi:phage shock protein A
MSDLFKKLGVLVRASINEVLGDEHAVGGPRRPPLTPEKLGKDIDREIKALRDKINDALAHEDHLQGQVNTLAAEAAQWDRQADEAVAAGNEAAARHAIAQMQRVQQRQTIAESDLHEHRLVTQELIQRVNMLEAVVADARRAREEEAAAQAQAAAPTAEEAARPAPLRGLADVLRESREKVAQMSDLISAKEEVSAQMPPPTAAQQAADAAAQHQVEDDLEARRQRLSKPKTP